MDGDAPDATYVRTVWHTRKRRGASLAAAVQNRPGLARSAWHGAGLADWPKILNFGNANLEMRRQSALPAEAQRRRERRRRFRARRARSNHRKPLARAKAASRFACRRSPKSLAHWRTGWNLPGKSGARLSLIPSSINPPIPPAFASRALPLIGLGFRRARLSRRAAFRGRDCAAGRRQPPSRSASARARAWRASDSDKPPPDCCAPGRKGG